MASSARNIFLFALIIAAQGSMAVAKPPSSTIKTFNFPKQSIGNLSLLQNFDKVPQCFVCQDNPLWTAKAEGVVQVATNPNKIVSLTLNNQALTSPMLMQVIQTKGIQCLQLGLYSMTPNEVAITDKSLQQIARFTDLEYLILDSSDASDKPLEVVESLKKLKGISACGTRINGSCFKSFAKLPYLEQVNIQRCNFDESNFVYLSKCPSLKKLDLRWTNISSKGIRLLAESKSLSTLFLTKEKDIDDESAVILGRMHNLRYLRLNTSPSITDKGVAALTSLRELKELGLQGTKVTDASISNLQKMSRLESLNVKDTAITENGLLKLKGLKLRQLLISEELFKPGFRKRLSLAFPNIRWEQEKKNTTTQDDVMLMLGPK